MKCNISYISFEIGIKIVGAVLAPFYRLKNKHNELVRQSFVKLFMTATIINKASNTLTYYYYETVFDTVLNETGMKRENPL